MRDLYESQSSIRYKTAAKASEYNLRRWLLWALKGDPSETRIKRESMGSKEQILIALVWIGAIS